MSFDVAHSIEGAVAPSGRVKTVIVDYPAKISPVYWVAAKRLFGEIVSPVASGWFNECGCCVFESVQNWEYIKLFFERDGKEAKVFQWQPLEKNFVARSLDWFLVQGRRV